MSIKKLLILTFSAFLLITSCKELKKEKTLETVDQQVPAEQEKKPFLKY